MTSPRSPSPQTVHGCAVAVGDRGLLIRGAAGAGKTTLLCEMLALGADLVADDRVLIRPADTAPTLSPPATLAGLIELRGAGIVRWPHRCDIPLWLIADLDATSDARMPHPQFDDLCGHRVRRIVCRARSGLAARLMVALRAADLPDPTLGPKG